MNKLITTYCFLFLLFVLDKSYAQYNQTVSKKDSLLVLKNGNIIQLAFNGSSLKKGTIVIEKNKIKEINYDTIHKEYPNAKIVNLKGKYILPGLIDTHVHLATALDKNRDTNSKQIESILLRMINSGITTVRDMAGNAIVLSNYARASRLNQITSPSIFYASQFAGSSYFNLIRSFPNVETKEDTPWAQSISDTTDLKIAIAKAKGSGATGIKIYTELSPELVTKIAEEAKSQNMQAWSHSAVFPASPKQIAKTKVNTMSHAWDMMYGLNTNDTITRKDIAQEINYNKLDSLLLLMKKNNIILDATNYIAENNGMTSGVKITKRAKELGIKVSVGTDWPYSYEPEIPFFKELRLLINKCGFTNEEALYSATKIGAESIGLTDRGTIEEGKRADIVVLEENPLKNIDNLKEVYFTIKSGIIYKKRKK